LPFATAALAIRSRRQLCKPFDVMHTPYGLVSLVANYIINKHYDIYGGVNWSEVTDGLANGFPGTTVGTSGSQNQTTIMWGFRIRI
jgi:hypothetical protein